jgi:excinuclease ABC subunit B
VQLLKDMDLGLKPASRSLLKAPAKKAEDEPGRGRGKGRGRGGGGAGTRARGRR